MDETENELQQQNENTLPAGTTPAAITPLPDSAIALNTATNDIEMEVHHHAHAEHGKKNWRSYFWEFLMLFLAVFCGSLAEYQLEHYVERQRAKDFAASLHRDLTTDLANIENTMARLNFCAKKIDTLIATLRNTKETPLNSARIYELSVYAFVSPVATPNESTLQQLLNSGSLRYFKNERLVDSIKVYNNNVQLLKKFSESAAEFNIDFRKMQLGIIDIGPIIKAIPSVNTTGDNKAGVIDTSFNNLALLTNDPAKLKEYVNWCALKKFYMLNSESYYKNVSLRGHGLMSALKLVYGDMHE